MKCDICGADPVTDMFEEMGITVVDVTPGRDVKQNTTSLNIDTPNVKENQ